MVKSCPDFYEWNARVQLTTWNPTPANASAIPGGPIDYASKHWNGLIGDYYAARAQGLLKLGLAAAAAGKALDPAEADRFKANLAYDWTNAVNPYPVSPVGDAVKVSAAMYAKYQPYFAQCSATHEL